MISGFYLNAVPLFPPSSPPPPLLSGMGCRGWANALEAGPAAPPPPANQKMAGWEFEAPNTEGRGAAAFAGGGPARFAGGGYDISQGPGA